MSQAWSTLPFCPYLKISSQWKKVTTELIFLGDVVRFAQNGFSTSEKKIRENPDEVYRMVRATLRGLQFVWDENHHETVTDIMMKQWRVSDRKMAAAMSKQVARVLSKDASVSAASVQEVTISSAPTPR